jgi:lipid A ethanolaminephosphotransferase
MISWLSPAFSAAEGLSRACVRAKTDEPLSHDNLFHSVLGLLDVHTRVYKPERDLFEDCRSGKGARYALN